MLYSQAKKQFKHQKVTTGHVLGLICFLMLFVAFDLWLWWVMIMTYDMRSCYIADRVGPSLPYTSIIARGRTCLICTFARMISAYVTQDKHICWHQQLRTFRICRINCAALLCSHSFIRATLITSMGICKMCSIISRLDSSRLDIIEHLISAQKSASSISKWIIFFVRLEIDPADALPIVVYSEALMTFDWIT